VGGAASIKGGDACFSISCSLVPTHEAWNIIHQQQQHPHQQHQDQHQ